MQEYNYELKKFLEHAKGKEIDIAEKVYDFILQSDDSLQLFKWFLKNVKNIKSTKEQEVEVRISREEFFSLQQSCNKMVVGILDNLLLEYLPEEEFYEALWQRIFQNNLLFSKREQKIYALLRIWKDFRIPYYEIDAGMKMNSEEYKQIADDKDDEIKKAIFITYSKFEQKTQRSSLFLKILEECESEKEKAVMLGIILSLIERRMQIEIFSKVRENKDDE